ncbi:MAG: hypothetical protein Q8M64_08310 [Methyloversatilis sp.]|nr:hypothetical protein [Methyloversatilis sp.]
MRIHTCGAGSALRAATHTVRTLAGALCAAALFALPAPTSAEGSGNELSYEAWIDSPRRFKCLYGYAADKTGDHAAAIRIFQDCVDRWNDGFSIIWLSQILETGVGVPQDLPRATALLRRGAESDDGDGYHSLTRYHYGVALFEGRGTAADPAAGEYWLRRAASEGVREADDYLSRVRAGEVTAARR